MLFVYCGLFIITFCLCCLENDIRLCVKLADFGSAMQPKDVDIYLKSFEVQTLYYRAPEVLKMLGR